MQIVLPKITSVSDTIRKPPFVKAQTALKNQNKIKYGEKRFSVWRMELLHTAKHDHDIDFARCNVACGSGIMTSNSPSGSTQQYDT